MFASVHRYRVRAAAHAHHLLAGMPTTVTTLRCSAPPPSNQAAGTTRMVLTIPTLNLTAPVLPGVSDSVLDGAVGHLSTSRWPDQGGTDVLEAHDVTFFSHLDQLHVGGVITLLAPCRYWTYRVTSTRVVAAGSPVTNNPSPTLVLVTCWPVNALFFTPQRYLVTAALTSAGTAGPTLPTPQTHSVPSPTVPAGLTSKQVSPDSVGVELGRLTTATTLGPNYAQSAQALQAADSADRTFDGAVLALRRYRKDWWNQVAPTIAMPTGNAALAVRRHWNAQVNITIIGSDGTVSGAALSTEVLVGSAPRQLEVEEASSHGRLVITSWHVGQ